MLAKQGPLESHEIIHAFWLDVNNFGFQATVDDHLGGPMYPSVRLNYSKS